MADMLPNEIHVFKSISCKLDAEHMLLLEYMVHTEKTPEGKQCREKSYYGYWLMVRKIADVKATIENNKLPDQYKLPWPCPEGLDTPYDTIGYTDNTKMCEGQFLTNKLKKMVDFDTFVKKVNGWKRNTDMINPTAAYPAYNYVSVKTGKVIDDIRTYTPEDYVKNFCGDVLVHLVELKPRLKKARVR